MTGQAGAFRVEPDVLGAHADRVAGIAAAVRAGRPSMDSFSDDAFGVIGGLFSGSATDAMGRGTVAVADLATALSVTAERLRACAGDYRETDAAMGQTFAGIDPPAAAGPVG